MKIKDERETQKKKRTKTEKKKRTEKLLAKG